MVEINIQQINNIQKTDDTSNVAGAAAVTPGYIPAEVQAAFNVVDFNGIDSVTVSNSVSSSSVNTNGTVEQQESSNYIQSDVPEYDMNSLTKVENADQYVQVGTAVEEQILAELKADGIINDGMSVQQLVIAMNDYVHDNFAYLADVGDHWNSVAETVQNGGGDCEDLANLEASLLISALKDRGMSEDEADKRVSLLVAVNPDTFIAHVFVQYTAENGSVTYLDPVSSSVSRSLGKLWTPLFNYDAENVNVINKDFDYSKLETAAYLVPSTTPPKIHTEPTQALIDNWNLMTSLKTSAWNAIFGLLCIIDQPIATLEGWGITGTADFKKAFEDVIAAITGKPFVEPVPQQLPANSYMSESSLASLNKEYADFLAWINNTVMPTLEQNASTAEKAFADGQALEQSTYALYWAAYQQVQDDSTAYGKAIDNAGGDGSPAVTQFNDAYAAWTDLYSPGFVCDVTDPDGNPYVAGSGLPWQLSAKMISDWRDQGYTVVITKVKDTTDYPGTDYESYYQTIKDAYLGTDADLRATKEALVTDESDKTTKSLNWVNAFNDVQSPDGSLYVAKMAAENKVSTLTQKMNSACYQDKTSAGPALQAYDASLQTLYSSLDSEPYPMITNFATYWNDMSAVKNEAYDMSQYLQGVIDAVNSSFNANVAAGGSSTLWPADVDAILKQQGYPQINYQDPQTHQILTASLDPSTYTSQLQPYLVAVNNIINALQSNNISNLGTVLTLKGQLDQLNAAISSMVGVRIVVPLTAIHDYLYRVEEGAFLDYYHSIVANVANNNANVYSRVYDSTDASTGIVTRGWYDAFQDYTSGMGLNGYQMHLIYDSPHEYLDLDIHTGHQSYTFYTVYRDQNGSGNLQWEQHTDTQAEYQQYTGDTNLAAYLAAWNNDQAATNGITAAIDAAQGCYDLATTSTLTDDMAAYQGDVKTFVYSGSFSSTSDWMQSMTSSLEAMEYGLEQLDGIFMQLSDSLAIYNSQKTIDKGWKNYQDAVTASNHANLQYDTYNGITYDNGTLYAPGNWTFGLNSWNQWPSYSPPTAIDSVAYVTDGNGKWTEVAAPTAKQISDMLQEGYIADDSGWDFYNMYGTDLSNKTIFMSPQAWSNYIILKSQEDFGNETAEYTNAMAAWTDASEPGFHVKLYTYIAGNLVPADSSVQPTGSVSAQQISAWEDAGYTVDIEKVDDLNNYVNTDKYGQYYSVQQYANDTYTTIKQRHDDAVQGSANIDSDYNNKSLYEGISSGLPVLWGSGRGASFPDVIITDDQGNTVTFQSYSQLTDLIAQGYCMLDEKEANPPAKSIIMSDQAWADYLCLKTVAPTLEQKTAANNNVGIKADDYYTTIHDLMNLYDNYRAKYQDTFKITGIPAIPGSATDPVWYTFPVDGNGNPAPTQYTLPSNNGLLTWVTSNVISQLFKDDPNNPGYKIIDWENSKLFTSWSDEVLALQGFLTGFTLIYEAKRDLRGLVEQELTGESNAIKGMPINQLFMKKVNTAMQLFQQTIADCLQTIKDINTAHHAALIAENNEQSQSAKEKIQGDKARWYQIFRKDWWNSGATTQRRLDQEEKNRLVKEQAINQQYQAVLEQTEAMAAAMFQRIGGRIGGNTGAQQGKSLAAAIKNIEQNWGTVEQATTNPAANPAYREPNTDILNAMRANLVAAMNEKRVEAVAQETRAEMRNLAHQEMTGIGGRQANLQAIEQMVENENQQLTTWFDAMANARTEKIQIENQITYDKLEIQKVNEKIEADKRQEARGFLGKVIELYAAAIAIAAVIFTGGAALVLLLAGAFALGVMGAAIGSTGNQALEERRIEQKYATPYNQGGMGQIMAPTVFTYVPPHIGVNVNEGVGIAPNANINVVNNQIMVTNGGNINISPNGTVTLATAGGPVVIGTVTTNNTGSPAATQPAGTVTTVAPNSPTANLPGGTVTSVNSNSFATNQPMALHPANNVAINNGNITINTGANLGGAVLNMAANAENSISGLIEQMTPANFIQWLNDGANKTNGSSAVDSAKMAKTMEAMNKYNLQLLVAESARQTMAEMRNLVHMEMTGIGGRQPSSMVNNMIEAVRGQQSFVSAQKYSTIQDVNTANNQKFQSDQEIRQYNEMYSNAQTEFWWSIVPFIGKLIGGEASNFDTIEFQQQLMREQQRANLQTTVQLDSTQLEQILSGGLINTGGGNVGVDAQQIADARTAIAKQFTKASVESSIANVLRQMRSLAHMEMTGIQSSTGPGFSDEALMMDFQTSMDMTSKITDFLTQKASIENKVTEAGKQLAVLDEQLTSQKIGIALMIVAAIVIAVVDILTGGIASIGLGALETFSAVSSIIMSVFNTVDSFLDWKFAQDQAVNDMGAIGTYLKMHETMDESVNSATTRLEKLEQECLDEISGALVQGLGKGYIGVNRGLETQYQRMIEQLYRAEKKKTEVQEQLSQLRNAVHEIMTGISGTTSKSAMAVLNINEQDMKAKIDNMFQKLEVATQRWNQITDAQKAEAKAEAQFYASVASTVITTALTVVKMHLQSLEVAKDAATSGLDKAVIQGQIDYWTLFSYGLEAINSLTKLGIASWEKNLVKGVEADRGAVKGKAKVSAVVSENAAPGSITETGAAQAAAYGQEELDAQAAIYAIKSKETDIEYNEALNTAGEEFFNIALDLAKYEYKKVKEKLDKSAAVPGGKPEKPAEELSEVAAKQADVNRLTDVVKKMNNMDLAKVVNKAIKDPDPQNLRDVITAMNKYMRDRLEAGKNAGAAPKPSAPGVVQQQTTMNEAAPQFQTEEQPQAHTDSFIEYLDNFLKNIDQNTKDIAGTVKDLNDGRATLDQLEKNLEQVKDQPSVQDMKDRVQQLREQAAAVNKQIGSLKTKLANLQKDIPAAKQIIAGQADAVQKKKGQVLGEMKKVQEKMEAFDKLASKPEDQRTPNEQKLLETAKNKLNADIKALNKDLNKEVDMEDMMKGLEKGFEDDIAGKETQLKGLQAQKNAINQSIAGLQREIAARLSREFKGISITENFNYVTPMVRNGLDRNAFENNAVESMSGSTEA